MNDFFNHFQIGQPSQWHWLWVVAACLLVSLYEIVERRRAAGLFATPWSLAQRLVQNSWLRELWLTGMVVTAMALMVVGLVDIRWGQVWREIPQKGIEVIFVLDVSRSMLAEDVTPSRLERAKQQISDVLDEMRGDRAGLVLFAGDVRQHIPLTNHYEDFRQRLQDVGPHDIPRGGSRLGDAIRVASQSFLTKTLDHKAIVIFSDGEDMESEPIAAARAAKNDDGIRIFTIGLGDELRGARVPGRKQGTYLVHQGEPVWTKLNREVLVKVAEEAGGAYVPAGTKQVDMSQVYHRYIASVDRGEFTTARISRYEARYQWFLAPAMILLVLEVWLRTWPPHTKPAGGQASVRKRVSFSLKAMLRGAGEQQNS